MQDLLFIDFLELWVIEPCQAGSVIIHIGADEVTVVYMLDEDTGVFHSLFVEQKQEVVVDVFDLGLLAFVYAVRNSYSAALVDLLSVRVFGPAFRIQFVQNLYLVYSRSVAFGVVNDDSVAKH